MFPAKFLEAAARIGEETRSHESSFGIGVVQEM